MGKLKNGEKNRDYWFMFQNGNFGYGFVNSDNSGSCRYNDVTSDIVKTTNSFDVMVRDQVLETGHKYD